MLRRLAWLLLAIAMAASAPARADQKDPRLDTLFDQLFEAPTAEAAKQVEQAIWAVWLESGSPTVDLLMQRAIVAMNEQQFDAALALFNTVVELAPDYAEGWNKRATLYYLMGRLQASIEDVERTLELEPRHFGALSGLGIIYAQQGEDEKALDAFERALIANPHLEHPRAEVERLKRKLRGEPI